MTQKNFKESIQQALTNPNLTGALGRFSEAYVQSRAKAYQGLNFEEIRGEIVRVKSDAASRLDELAAEFQKNAEARGAHVFRANSPEAVRDYILALAQKNGVKAVVKSKSMASEEIHLNQHLEKSGIGVKETDLGEWIIQLAGQKPSHMVMPAIHLTKEEVAEIFSKEVNERLTNDIPRLVKVARRELRGKFLEADLGISGANIAVAETGTLVLMTNEGNARLVTSLPKIHVAIVGVEKLVPKVNDIVPIITALPKSATGQLITSYVSMITGPTPNTDGSMKDLHIILMDNHRTDMAKDPQFKQALQCIRCASCLNVCPVYRLVGGHVFGHVYTGGIGTILTAWFDELKKSDELQSLCIGCGNCKTVCPGNIDIPDLILELRRKLAVENGQPLAQKAAFSVVNNRKVFHSLLRAASKVQKPLTKDGFIRHLPMFLSELTEVRSLPAIAETPLRDQVKTSDPASAPAKTTEKAALYGGCLIDFAYPEMGTAVIRVLNKAGIEVIFPQDQTCCGAPARYAGAYEVAANNAIDNIQALLREDVKYIVSACPTCTLALKHEFTRMLEAAGKTEWLPRAQELAAKVVDFSTLVKRMLDEGRLQFKEGQKPGKCTYHDSCHLKRTLGVSEEPRELLKKAGYEFVEMFEADMCCGMGGSYCMKMPEISAPMLKRKLANIEKTEATTVAMDCPGCVMQIRGGADKAARKSEGGKPTGLSVKHTAELIEKLLK